MRALICLSLVVLPMNSSAYTAQTLVPLKYCEDARLSNKKARRWETANYKMPSSDKKYRLFINKSTWCSIDKATNGGGHWSIVHYSASGVGSEIQIHKSGQKDWIKSNWRTLKKVCGAPRSFTLRKLLYRKQPGKKCWAYPSLNMYGSPRIHQWGVGRKKTKQIRALRSFHLGKKRF